jgi:hypothetical protein
VLNSCIQLVILGEFISNRAYITKTYCVNKNKPSMHCMGMCHLKKIFKDHGKEQQDPGSQGKVWQESIGLPELLPTIYFILPSENFLQEIFYLNKLPPGCIFSIFHPPSGF